jgi:hypothetical protein
MKNSTPISLFSFQDIITSLTGIMIVVVLIISLQLVESSQAVAAIAKLRPEYDVLKKAYQQQLEKRKNLEKKIVSKAEAAEKYAKYSLEEINKIINEEEVFSGVLNEKKIKAEKALSDVVRQNAQRKVRIEQLKKELKDLSRHKDEIKELQAEMLALQKEQANISSLIQRKSKKLRFEFAGLDNQTPLLIECNAWGFRCKRYPDGEVVTFGNPDSGSLPKQLAALEKWINDNGISESYPVLLYREESAVYYERIVQTLFKIYRKKSWGSELVGQHEEIF